MHRRVADVFRGVRQRIAIEHVAGFELALGGLAVGRVVAVPTALQNINHVRRMRMHLLFDAGRQVRLEHADTIVFEFNFYGLGINDSRILRGCRNQPNAEAECHNDCGGEESHAYEKDFLASELQGDIVEATSRAIMDNETIYKPAATPSDPRVQLAFERTFLAYERTRIAWVRTALALISFGFVIAEFFQYLREKQGETATLLSPRAVGLVMITIGLVGLILANLQQRRAVKALRERCPELPAPVSGVMAVLIALLGVLALIGALLR